jgi:hypothetical protein
VGRLTPGCCDRLADVVLSASRAAFHCRSCLRLMRALDDVGELGLHRRGQPRFPAALKFAHATEPYERMADSNLFQMDNACLRGSCYG